jgi:hypothetical protein
MSTEPHVDHRPVGVERLNRRHRKTSKSAQASRLTNNSALVPRLDSGCTDGRSAWSRRIKDLVALHSADLGGWSEISATQATLLRRLVTLTAELERREAMFARVGYVDDVALSVFVTGTNCLRRLAETLGIERKLKVITPTLADALAKLDREQPVPIDGQAIDGGVDG